MGKGLRAVLLVSLVVLVVGGIAAWLHGRGDGAVADDPHGPEQGDAKDGDAEEDTSLTEAEREYAQRTGLPSESPEQRKRIKVLFAHDGNRDGKLDVTEVERFLGSAETARELGSNLEMAEELVENDLAEPGPVRSARLAASLSQEAIARLFGSIGLMARGPAEIFGLLDQEMRDALGEQYSEPAQAHWAAVRAVLSFACFLQRFGVVTAETSLDVLVAFMHNTNWGIDPQADRAVVRCLTHLVKKPPAGPAHAGLVLGYFRRRLAEASGSAMYADHQLVKPDVREDEIAKTVEALTTGIRAIEG